LPLLAVIPYLGRQRSYPFPTPNPAPKFQEAHSPLSAADTNLLLISIDTLRSDHLSGYGYERDTAPTLQRLMEKGIHFQGVTTRSQTAAAMATLLTGTYPPTHGLLDNRESLASANLSLAEILQSRGHGTWAVVSNPVIGTAFGFDQGFDRFLTPPSIRIVSAVPWA
jgi:arylsulfatase A-like enzyme